MYISRVLIENVRCFENIELQFDLEGDSPPWAMIVGDNATGKTTLLRCIALGLCDESGAASLLKESEEGYNRRGSRKNAKIEVELKDSQARKIYKITTTIDRLPIEGAKRDYLERVRQEVYPEEGFPWKKIFACAYGAGRGTSGTGDIAGYSVINAVYNLFNYGEGLQNPELTIRRMRGDFSKNEVFFILNELLPETKRFDLADFGITVDGPWGADMPLRDLADGYKSTFLWITDFLGWALSHNSRIKKKNEICGIVLVDELEQHLHPKWQRMIVRDLKNQFPKVQFITTTHSPLVASSIGRITEAIDRDRLFHLSLQERNRVIIEELKESLKGYRADQVLASKAFDYLIEAAPDLEDALAEWSHLAGLGENRNANEDRQFRELEEQLSRHLLKAPGTTAFERDYFSAELKETKRIIQEKESSGDTDDSD